MFCECGHWLVSYFKNIKSRFGCVDLLNYYIIGLLKHFTPVEPDTDAILSFSASTNKSLILHCEILIGTLDLYHKSICSDRAVY